MHYKHYVNEVLHFCNTEVRQISDPVCPSLVPKLDGMSHSMEYTVGQFGSGALAGHEKLKNP